MKKYFVFLAVSLFAIQFAKADHDMLTTDMGRLPQKAQELVRTHFAQEKLSYIKIEEEILSTDYEARFESGTEIEFTGSGEWKSIGSPVSADLLSTRTAGGFTGTMVGVFATGRY